MTRTIHRSLIGGGAAEAVRSDAGVRAGRRARGYLRAYRNASHAGVLQDRRLQAEPGAWAAWEFCAGRDRQNCSPRHSMPFNSKKGFTIRWMTWRETLRAKLYGVVTTHERGIQNALDDVGGGQWASIRHRIWCRLRCGKRVQNALDDMACNSCPAQCDG